MSPRLLLRMLGFIVAVLLNLLSEPLGSLELLLKVRRRVGFDSGCDSDGFYRLQQVDLEPRGCSSDLLDGMVHGVGFA